MTDGGPENPTDALVMAMERADEIEEIIILYRLQRDESTRGVGWITTVKSTGSQVGLLEEGKMAILCDAYNIRTGDEEA